MDMSNISAAVAVVAPVSAPKNIWAGDLFGRKQEAELLIAYIESVGRRPIVREDHRGFTISVDADYGVGKSYFLKRLAEQLSESHPVAFVDAWSDDLADEPLTAIAATLKTALADFIVSSPEVKARWDEVAKKTGEVAKIVALGALKKGLGLLITGAAVDAAEGVLGGLSSEDAEAARGALKGVGQDATDSAVDAMSKKSGRTLMEERISAFRDGQNAIAALKQSLIDLVDALPVDGKDVPIVIIIDELDRCRPTYAVKLLEETKHLFDIPGIVFVLGMHADQLSHSVAGAYGPGFEGGAYLRRFINRQYKLSHPDTEPLLRHLIDQYRINVDHLVFMPVSERLSVSRDADAVVIIAQYMLDYKLTARDAFTVVEILQTCVALAGRSVFMPMLLPMILNKVRGVAPTESLQPVVRDWHYTLYGHQHDAAEQQYEPERVFDEMLRMARWSIRDISKAANDGDLIAYWASDFVERGPRKLGSFPSYERLLESVGRFSDPDT